MAADTEEKKRPDYSPKKGGKCSSECKYYKTGYCEITGACLTRPKAMIGPVMQADCGPFITDLRRNAKADWPEYQVEEPKAAIDESVGEQILKELRKISERLGAFHKNFKKH